MTVNKGGVSKKQNIIKNIIYKYDNKINLHKNAEIFKIQFHM